MVVVTAEYSQFGLITKILSNSFPMIVFPYKVTRKTSFPIFFPWFVVPEPGYRRRGLGLEAARLMMAFGESVISPVFITITVAVVFGCVV